MSASKPIIKLLQELGFIKASVSADVVDSAAEGPLLFLSRNEHFDERQAIEKIAHQLRIEVANLDVQQPAFADETKEIVAHLGVDFCWSRKVLPVRESAGSYLVAFANPLDHDTRKLIEFTLGKGIIPQIAEERKIASLLRAHFPATKLDLDDLADLEAASPVEIMGAAQRDEHIDIENSDMPPVVKLCNKILAEALASDASDIHIEPVQYGVEVRFRVDGVMSSIFEFPKKLQPYVTTRFKLLAGMDIAERRRPQDGRLRVRAAGEVVDLRVSCIPTANGEKVVLRILRGDSDFSNLAALGLSDSVEPRVRQALDRMGKLLLITGPTGSGKTTTLYAFLHYLQDGTSNMVTVEDPVEYRIPGLNQIQVNEAINVSFASALRSILRQDPDVIMIGEIRDAETAGIALQAAQTGHFVLSTLHTNDAPSTINRLIDLGVERYIVASSLGGVLSQRLVRLLCAECALPPDAGYLAKYAALIEQHALSSAAIRQPVGCERCKFSGYRGRSGLFSYLEITDEISALIHSNASMPAIVEAARKSGYLDLQQAACAMLNIGHTSIEEVAAFLGQSENSVIVPGKAESAAAMKAAPLEKALPQTAISTTSPETTATPAILKQRILIVEDDVNVREILGLLFEKEMFEVLQAANGQEALEQVYKCPPHIILCDLMMPVMDGREFLLSLKKHSETRGIPVVMLTAVDSEDNEIELINLGARDFVSKASSPKVMMSRIRRVLESSARHE